MTWIAVDEPGDPRIEEFLGLRDHELRRRRESPGGDLAGIFIAEGDLVVQRALRAGYRMRSALVDATRSAAVPDEIGGDVTVFAAGPEVVRRITGMGVHRGMMASFDRRPLPSVDEVLAGARRVVVLEDVNNPTNLGVIARSAAALGIDALLLDPSCCDPLYRRASRVAMGEVFALPWTRLPRFPDGLDPLVDAGFTLLALTPDPSAEALDQLGLGDDEKVALVLGAEGPGLTEDTMTKVGRRARIPIRAGVDSLNVGVAAAIACYEVGRAAP
jgi:tRNA G18 (ribose-2'-O)-methylase SpoU